VGAALVVIALALWHPVPSSAQKLANLFRKGIPLDLPGAGSIRLSEPRTAELEWVARNLEQNGDTFVGIPGMHSFYLWASMPSPVPFYSNAWVLFLDEAERAELARALLASHRPCIVRNLTVLDFWTGSREAAPDPLTRAAEHDFRRVGSVGDYELLLPKDARPDLVLSMLSEPAPPALRQRFGVERALRLSFPVMPDTRVARIVVRDMAHRVDLFDSSATSDARHASIVDGGGEALLGAGTPGSIDLARRSEIYLVDPTASLAPECTSTLVRAHDASGRVVARLLIPSGTDAK
jgi:hypothetical protein